MEIKLKEMRKISEYERAKAVFLKYGIDVHMTPLDDEVVVNFFKREDIDDDGYPVGRHIGFFKINPDETSKVFDMFAEKFPQELL